MLSSWHFKPSPFMWGLSASALVQGIARSRESQTCNSKGYFRSGLQRIISSAFNKLCKKKPLYYALNCRCLYKRSQIPVQAGFLLLFTLELYSCRSFIPRIFPTCWPDVCCLHSMAGEVALHLSDSALPGAVLVMLLFVRPENKVARWSGNSTKGPATKPLPYSP